jgi:hypothetical protein
VSAWWICAYPERFPGVLRGLCGFRGWQRYWRRVLFSGVGVVAG